MALKYQAHFRIYIYLFPKFQEYSVLMAAKNAVFTFFFFFKHLRSLGDALLFDRDAG